MISLSSSVTTVWEEAQFKEFLSKVSEMLG